MTRSQRQSSNGRRLGRTRPTVGASRLCSTCRHGADCSLRGTDGPAAYCEEFEPPAPGETAPAPAAPAAPACGPQSGQGLCGNCLNRETCRLASSEGGVWHCEEYR